MKSFGPILVAVGGSLAAVVLFGGLGAGAGWLLDRVAGPPSTWRSALHHGGGTGLILGALVAYVFFRGPKGPGMGVATLFLGMIGALLLRWLAGSWAPPGWLFGATLWGGGLGALLALFLPVGLLAGYLADRHQRRPPGKLPDAK